MNLKTSLKEIVKKGEAGLQPSLSPEEWCLLADLINQNGKTFYEKGLNEGYRKGYREGQNNVWNSEQFWEEKN